MEKVKEQLLLYLPKIGIALIIAAVGILIAFIVVKLTHKALVHKKIDPSLVSFVCRTVRILIYVFTLFAALSFMEISIAGLVAFFSAAAAAVALALKDRLNDIASGIVILFSKPFVTGDFIEFGSHSGYVQKVDILHTNILTYDGTNVIVPNSVISSSEVNNYTANPIVRVQIKVPIPYSADVKQIRSILLSVMDCNDLLVRDEKHTPVVRLESFEESSLEILMRCYCDFKDYWAVYYDVIERAKEALDDNNISIPFNQLDVHINP